MRSERPAAADGPVRSDGSSASHGGQDTDIPVRLAPQAVQECSFLQPLPAPGEPAPHVQDRLFSADYLRSVLPRGCGSRLAQLWTKPHDPPAPQGPRLTACGACG